MKINIKKLAMAGILAGAVLAPVSAISADQDKVIAHRQANFAAISKVAGNITGILKGEVENKESLVALTKALVALTDPNIIVPPFKQDTRGSSIPNRGADKIWEDFAKFEAGAVAMNKGAIKIADLAAKGELVSMEPMGPTLFSTCGFCHRVENFRGPEIE